MHRVTIHLSIWQDVGPHKRFALPPAVAKVRRRESGLAPFKVVIQVDEAGDDALAALA